MSCPICKFVLGALFNQMHGIPSKHRRGTQAADLRCDACQRLCDEMSHKRYQADIVTSQIKSN